MCSQRLGAILGSVAIGSAAMLKDPPDGYLPVQACAAGTKGEPSGRRSLCAGRGSVRPAAPEYVLAGRYTDHVVHLFLNIMAGISIVSFLSPFYQDIWRLDHPTLERSVLAGYGATLIAVSPAVQRRRAHRLGRCSGAARPYQHLSRPVRLAAGRVWHPDDGAQSVGLRYSGVLCAELLRGGFAIMPSMVSDVYGTKRMSRLYGVILTAWSAAGILGPMMVASLKDNYPDRAIVYSFLLGILVLGVGFIFSFLVNDDRFIPRRILLQVFAMAPPPDVRPRKALERRGVGARSPIPEKLSRHRRRLNRIAAFCCDALSPRLALRHL